MAFDLSHYETVAERLQRALNDHPDLRIITEIVDIARDPNTNRPLQYVVKASLYYGDVLKAVDYAEEIVGSSHINKSSALENALYKRRRARIKSCGLYGYRPKQ
jgi:ATP-dependent helicase/DNAse subunit B